MDSTTSASVTQAQQASLSSLEEVAVRDDRAGERCCTGFLPGRGRTTVARRGPRRPGRHRLLVPRLYDLGAVRCGCRRDEVRRPHVRLDRGDAVFGTQDGIVPRSLRANLPTPRRTRPTTRFRRDRHARLGDLVRTLPDGHGHGSWRAGLPTFRRERQRLRSPGCCCAAASVILDRPPLPRSQSQVASRKTRPASKADALVIAHRLATIRLRRDTS